jgi:hypothetical protein
MDRFVHASTEGKNASIAFAVINETVLSTSKHISDLEEKTTVWLNSQLRDHCKKAKGDEPEQTDGGRKKAKKRLKEFKKHQQAKKAKAPLKAQKSGSAKQPWADSSDSDSSDSEPEKSQESLLGLICSVQRDIKTFEMQNKKAMNETDAYLNLKNKK